MESRKTKIYYYNLGIHNYVKNLLNNPPEGYEFVINDDQEKKGTIEKLKKYTFLKFLYKNIFKKVFNVFNLINKTYYIESPPETDLIFSTGTIIKEKKPWIIKILDTPFGIAGNDYNVFIRNRSNLEQALASEYCKKIIVHTERARKHMEKYFSDKVTNKIIKIDPAIPGSIIKREARKDNEVRFLFMGSINNPDEFYMKGGLEAIEAFNILSKKYSNIRLRVRCKVPGEVKESYSNPKIEFLEKQMEYEEIKKLYRESDVLIMPGYGGYFIMVYLEAFSYGLPIIALNTYGSSEFVINGKTGFVVEPSKNAPINVPEYPTNTRTEKFIKIIKEKDPKVIGDLVDKCSILVENKKLRQNMAAECQKAFKTTYSFEKKISKLKKVFDEALEN